MAPSAPESSSSSSGGSRYYPLRPLATGGMATVDLALQVSPGGFERLAALKRVKPHLASSEDIAAMFSEEARIAARLNLPNLIHAYEVGRDAAGLFLAMEYLSGQTLRSVVERVGPEKLDFRVAVETLIATLDGLECVHELRDMAGHPMLLVHRDISPSNIFLTYTGQVKVLDFGIAKARLSSIQTEIGVLKGKVAYMAPEQALGSKVDARADLYAVGVMLWEAIAGRRRWGDTPEGKVVEWQMSGEAPESPGARERGLPLSAEQICLKALAFEPADRFGNAAEFRAALEALSDELGPRLGPRGLSEYVLGYFEIERVHGEQQVERALSTLDRGATTSSGFTPPRRETRAVAQPVGQAFAPPKTPSKPPSTRLGERPQTRLGERPKARPSERPRAPAGEQKTSTAPGADTDHTLTVPGLVRSKRGLWFGAAGIVAALAALTWARVRGSEQPTEPKVTAQVEAVTANESVAPTPVAAPAVSAARPVAVATALTPVAPAETASSPLPSVASKAPASSTRTKANAPHALKASTKQRGLSLDRGSPW